jgi:hypothetical protein
LEFFPFSMQEFAFLPNHVRKPFGHLILLVAVLHGHQPP